MYRAARAFRKVGIEVTSAPFPYVLKRTGAWTERWSLFLELVMETAKIVDYRVHGWI
jgi:hypothetical protein